MTSPKVSPLTYVLLAGASMFTSSLAYAETSEEDTVLLDTIVVEASKMGNELGQSTQPVTVITADQIAAQAQVDLTEVLRTQPSFEFKKAGGPGQFNYPRLRGFSDGILYVFDGVKVNEGRSGGVNGLVGKIDPTALERIEILRGPQATLYGADSTAGVVSVTTKSGEVPAASLGAEAGSLDWNKYMGAYRDGVKLGDGNLYYALSASNIDSGGVHEYEYFKDTSLNGRLSYETGSLEIGASVFRTDNKFSSAELDEAYCCQTEDTYWSFQTPDPNNYNETEATIVSTWIRHQISDRWSHKLVVGGLERTYDTIDLNDGLLGYQSAPYDDFTFDSVTYAEGEAVPIYETYDTRNYSTSKNQQATYDLLYSGDRLTALVGGEYWKQEYNSHGSYGESDEDQNVKSLYGHLKYDIIPEKFVTELGLRYDEYNAWGSETTYSVGASYQVLPTTGLYANYGTSFTQPTLTQLFSAYYGDPTLTPATGETIEAGVRHETLDGRLHGSLTIYQTEVDNVIAYDYSIENPANPYGGYGRYANRDGKRSRGVELDATYDISDALNVRTVYSYIDAEEADSGSEYTRVVQTAYNSGSVSLNYNTAQIDLGASLYYTGERLRWAADLEMPAYTRLDLSARYHVNDWLSVYSRVENALDEDIIEGLGYEQPGVYAIFGFSLSFDPS